MSAQFMQMVRRIRWRLERWELPHLRELAARQERRIERMRKLMAAQREQLRRARAAAGRGQPAGEPAVKKNEIGIGVRPFAGLTAGAQSDAQGGAMPSTEYPKEAPAAHVLKADPMLCTGSGDATAAAGASLPCPHDAGDRCFPFLAPPSPTQRAWLQRVSDEARRARFAR